jgi:hypothetical protein
MTLILILLQHRGKISFGYSRSYPAIRNEIFLPCLKLSLNRERPKIEDYFQGEGMNASTEFCVLSILSLREEHSWSSKIKNSLLILFSYLVIPQFK